MSKIVLSGNASGTGTLTIASPNTDTDRTLTLPDSAGTLDTLQRAGNVLQVVSASTGAEVSSSVDSYIDTGLTASITPTSATSKILVLVQQNGCRKSSANSNNMLDIRLVRGGTVLGAFASALASTGSALENIVSAGFSFLDSPATTSSVSYRTDFRSRNSTASVAVQYASVSVSSIVLLEIAA